MTAVEGVGPQLDRAAAGTDPRGQLVFAWLPPEIQNAEDSTQAADRERAVLKPRGFERPSTDTERILLEHLGHVLPADLTTFVKWVSTGVRNRRFPALEGEPTP